MNVLRKRYGYEMNIWLLRMKSKIKVPLCFNESKSMKLAKIGKQTGRKVLKLIACIVKSETILECFRRLVATQFDGSEFRKKGRKTKS